MGLRGPRASVVWACAPSYRLGEGQGVRGGRAAGAGRQRAGAAVDRRARVLRVRLTGELDGRAAYGAIKAAKDRGWESYRAIVRFIANAEECCRRQILEHFGDSQEEAREGRCCSVCAPAPELAIGLP